MSVLFNELRSGFLWMQKPVLRLDPVYLKLKLLGASTFSAFLHLGFKHLYFQVVRQERRF